MITRIHKQLAQQIVETVKDVCGQNINFIDENGIIFASTDEKRIGDFHEIGRKVMQSKVTIEVEEDNIYSGTKQGVNIPVYHNNRIIAVIGISGKPSEVRKYAYLAEKITLLLIREQELNNFNRAESERKTYILDTLINKKELDHDFLAGVLNELGIDVNDMLRTIIIRMNPRYHISNISMIQHHVESLFQNSNIKLYYFHYPNEYVGVIAASDFYNKLDSLHSFADKNNPILSIAIGMENSIYHIDRSYESSCIALKSMEFSSQNFSIYDDLNLEIILGNLDQHIQEAFLKKTILKLKQQDIQILSSYYENEMLLNKTAEALFMHKNTLQYRLNHIWHETGFNPRNFSDAVILYLGLRMNAAHKPLTEE